MSSSRTSEATRWLFVVCLAAFLYGCDGLFNCGPAYDVVTISGLLTITASTGDSIDSYYNYLDNMSRPDDVDPAVDALRDLDGDDHAFSLEGIHSEGMGPNRISRGLRFKLSTPFEEGDQLDFNVERSSSGGLMDAPALGWNQFEGELRAIPLVSASASVTEVDPLVLSVELEADDGRLGRGDFAFVHEKERSCD